MGYIIALLLVIGGILAVTVGTNPLASLIDQTKATVTEFVSPKTPTEIIIDNTKPSHEALERFFSTTAPKIMRSQTLAPQERTEVEQAIEAFAESQEALAEIRQAEQSETSIVESVIKKVLQTELLPTPRPSASATPLPPQCRVECDDRN